MSKMISTLFSKIFSKRMLYLLCFVAINIFEFCKATQNGDVWYVTSNLTGIIVFIIIASTYTKREVLNRFNGIWTIVVLIGMGLIYYYKIAYPEHYFHLGQTLSAALNVWWIGIATNVLFRRSKGMERPKFRNISICVWLWVSLMLLMTISINEAIWPLWFLAMFGIFYLTKFSKPEWDGIVDGLLNGTLLSFFAFQGFAYLARPYDQVRYVGFQSNSNTVALYYLIVYIFVLYKLHIHHIKKSPICYKIFYLIGAGVLLCFQIFTICRTAWIASILATFVYGVIVMKRIWKQKWHQIIKRGALLSLTIVLMFLPVFYSIRWIPALTPYRIWFLGEYTVDSVHSFDPPNSEKYVELDEFFDTCFGRITQIIKVSKLRNPFVLHVHAMNTNYLEKAEEVLELPWLTDLSLSIRLTVYRAYLRDMTWMGNSNLRGHYPIQGQDYVSWHAQNLWIQIGYYFGVPAMLLLIALSIVLLLTTIRNTLIVPSNSYAIIPLLVCIIFLAFGLMEVVWLPGQFILFLIFFTQHPQFSELLDC